MAFVDALIDNDGKVASTEHTQFKTGAKAIPYLRPKRPNNRYPIADQDG